VVGGRRDGVVLRGLYPRVWRLLGNGGPVPNYTSPAQVDCVLTLSGMRTATPWWAVRCGDEVAGPTVAPPPPPTPATRDLLGSSGDGGDGSNDGDGGGGGGGGAAMTIHSDGSEWISPCESRGGGPEVVLISSEVATGALASFSKLVGGLTGMYVVYVLAVGSFARTFTTNLVTHIPYNEFPCTARLTALCEDIYAMRHVREFVLEERLYWILIRIYRRGTFTAADSRMYPGELG